MVWCGVVWCGWCGEANVVWCGVVWCGVVWCGVVWCGEAIEVVGDFVICLKDGWKNIEIRNSGVSEVW